MYHCNKKHRIQDQQMVWIGAGAVEAGTEAAIVEQIWRQQNGASATYGFCSAI
jgi:hypothetical protein